MRNGGIKVFQALTTAELSNIIPVIEKGLELERLEQMANKESKATHRRIYDTELLLTFLHLRKLGDYV